MTLEVHGDAAAALQELRAISNDGRWGPDDQRGTLNLVTEDCVRRAAALVKQGVVLPLGEVVGPDSPAILDHPAHQLRVRESVTFGDTVQSAVDSVTFAAMHGSVTHVDALCHVGGIDRKLYNGVAEGEVTEAGARRLGIENVKGIVTRGVLLDLARARGVDVLPWDYVAAEDDIRTAAAAAGVELESGDAVLLRTGFRRVYSEDPDLYRSFQPGIGPSAALYLARHDVAVIGADTIAVEAMNLGPDAASDARAAACLTNRLHPHLLRHLGVYLLELLNLDALADSGVVEFQFCMAPLMIEGATASPVNPLAIY